jgi:hypothetical protein
LAACTSRNTDAVERLVSISFYSYAIFVMFILNSIFGTTDIWRLGGYWASDQFRAVSEQNLWNWMRKELVHRYGADGNVLKT